MKNITRYLAAGSVVALMAAFSLTASAQDRGRSTGDRPSMDSGGADACIGIECMPGRVGEPDRIGKPDAGDRVQRRQDMDQRREEQAQRDWNYDPNRHKRTAIRTTVTATIMVGIGTSSPTGPSRSTA